MVNYTIKTNGTGQGDFNFTKFAKEKNLPNGAYEVVAIHYEDNYYTGILSDPIEVNVKNPINVTVSNETGEGNVGDEIEVEFTVNSTDGSVISEGKLTVTVKGTEYSADVKDGKATFTFGPFDEAFELNGLEVTYNGTNKYATAVGYLNLTVKKIPVIVIVENITCHNGDVKSVKITVIEAETGEEVTGGEVTYSIDYSTRRLSADGDSYPVDGSEATAETTLNGAPGLYDSEATYSGTNKYEAGSGVGTAEILKLNTTTESEDVSGKKRRHN